MPVADHRIGSLALDSLDVVLVMKGEAKSQAPPFAFMSITGLS
jgi:hypothetical protein